MAPNTVKRYFRNFLSIKQTARAIRASLSFFRNADQSGWKWKQKSCWHFDDLAYTPTMLNGKNAPRHSSCNGAFKSPHKRTHNGIVTTMLRSKKKIQSEKYNFVREREREKEIRTKHKRIYFDKNPFFIHSIFPMGLSKQFYFCFCKQAMPSSSLLSYSLLLLLLLLLSSKMSHPIISQHRM